MNSFQGQIQDGGVAGEGRGLCPLICQCICAKKIISDKILDFLCAESQHISSLVQNMCAKIIKKIGPKSGRPLWTNANLYV